MCKQGGRTSKDFQFSIKGNTLDTVDSFTYLGIVFSPVGYFNQTFETLTGQAMKAHYILKSYPVKLPGVSVKHKLDLLDKLVLPIFKQIEGLGINRQFKTRKDMFKLLQELIRCTIPTSKRFHIW